MDRRKVEADLRSGVCSVAVVGVERAVDSAVPVADPIVVEPVDCTL